MDVVQRSPAGYSPNGQYLPMVIRSPKCPTLIGDAVMPYASGTTYEQVAPSG